MSCDPAILIAVNITEPKKQEFKRLWAEMTAREPHMPVVMFVEPGVIERADEPPPPTTDSTPPPAPDAPIRTAATAVNLAVMLPPGICPVCHKPAGQPNCSGCGNLAADATDYSHWRDIACPVKLSPAAVEGLKQAWAQHMLGPDTWTDAVHSDGRRAERADRAQREREAMMAVTLALPRPRSLWRRLARLFGARSGG